MIYINISNKIKIHVVRGYGYCVSREGLANVITFVLFEIFDFLSIKYLIAICASYSNIFQFL